MFLHGAAHMICLIVKLFVYLFFFFSIIQSKKKTLCILYIFIHSNNTEISSQLGHNAGGG